MAKVDATQQLNGAGVGQDKLKGDTRGIYATWMSPTGFYLDTSYRQMNFEAQLSSTAGPLRTHGDADALNLEMGYAWTFDNGVKVETQIQSPTSCCSMATRPPTSATFTRSRW